MTELDWHPTLDQPIQQLEEVLAATDQQQPKNYTSSNLAFALDAKLYLVFFHYFATVSEASQPEVLREQRRWLAQRQQIADAAHAEFSGGTLASFAGNRAFIIETQDRINEIERRLGSEQPRPQSGKQR